MRRASVPHLLLIFSVTANAAAPGGFFLNAPATSVLSSFDQWLLSQYHYSFNPDGTLFAPHNDKPIPKSELPQILRHLKSSQRLKVLFQLDLIFNENPSGDSLTPEEKAHVRKLLKENWPIFTEGLRLEFKHYFSKEEFRALNAQSPPAVEKEQTALLSEPEEPLASAPSRPKPVAPALKPPHAATDHFMPPPLVGPAAPAAMPVAPPAPSAAPAAPTEAKPNAILAALQETQKDISLLVSLQTMSMLASLRGGAASANDSQKTLLALLQQQSSLLTQISTTSAAVPSLQAGAGGSAPGASPPASAASSTQPPSPPSAAAPEEPKEPFDASAPHPSQVVLPALLASMAWTWISG